MSDSGRCENVEPRSEIPTSSECEVARSCFCQNGPFKTDLSNSLVFRMAVNLILNIQVAELAIMFAANLRFEC